MSHDDTKEPGDIGGQAELFHLDPQPPRLRARVIILTGPSGSGKTSLSVRLGLPSLALDNFYRNDVDPDMPILAGDVIDWDDPASWDRQGALEALTELCVTGRAEIPIYDIPTNRRTGTQRIDLGENRLFIAEGIFASLLVEPLTEAGLAAAALCIARSPLRNAWFRLLRDLGEGRKSLPVLLYRGTRLALAEPAKVRGWVAHGCVPVRSLTEAEAQIRALSGPER